MSITDKTRSCQRLPPWYLLAKVRITHTHQIWPWALWFVCLSTPDPRWVPGIQFSAWGQERRAGDSPALGAV